uniref:Uncharacterized protein n=1 Tax=Rhizophagus irregularis (strain DAOM 181602 / DAOM 197198 / MUCL 43194) TaxID=747089 RepID=U9SXU6_RHIID
MTQLTHVLIINVKNDEVAEIEKDKGIDNKDKRKRKKRKDDDDDRDVTRDSLLGDVTSG